MENSSSISNIELDIQEKKKEIINYLKLYRFAYLEMTADSKIDQIHRILCKKNIENLDSIPIIYYYLGIYCEINHKYDPCHYYKEAYNSGIIESLSCLVQFYKTWQDTNNLNKVVQQGHSDVMNLLGEDKIVDIANFPQILKFPVEVMVEVQKSIPNWTTIIEKSQYPNIKICEYFEQIGDNEKMKKYFWTACIDLNDDISNKFYRTKKQAIFDEISLNIDKFIEYMNEILKVVNQTKNTKIHHRFVNILNTHLDKNFNVILAQKFVEYLSMTHSETLSHLLTHMKNIVQIDNDLEMAKCPVCFEESKVICLPCSHQLCCNCWNNIIRGQIASKRKKYKCPVCRASYGEI